MGDKDTFETKISTTTTVDITKSKEGQVKLNYYTKKLTDKKTKKVIYELHGNCYIYNLDVTGYDDATERTVGCEIGLGDKDSTVQIDYMKLSSKFKLSDTDTVVWDCQDGY